MMSLNRLALKHNARIGNKGARRVKVIGSARSVDRRHLIGNNFVNILASAIATVLATRWLGRPASQRPRYCHPGGSDFR